MVGLIIEREDGGLLVSASDSGSRVWVLNIMALSYVIEQDT